MDKKLYATIVNEPDDVRWRDIPHAVKDEGGMVRRIEYDCKKHKIGRLRYVSTKTPLATGKTLVTLTIKAVGDEQVLFEHLCWSCGLPFHTPDTQSVWCYSCEKRDECQDSPGKDCDLCRDDGCYKSPYYESEDIEW